MENYSIETIQNYPDNGKHQECFIDLPFQIRKGEDGYYYKNKKGVELKYNIFKSEKKIDERWICHITPQANDSLENIFEIKAHKDLNTIIKYCVKMYKKSLKMELKRVDREFEKVSTESQSLIGEAKELIRKVGHQKATQEFEMRIEDLGEPITFKIASKVLWYKKIIKFIQEDSTK